MLTTIVALPDEFPEHLAGYCQQATAAAKANKHHDYRRALLIDFLRKAFGIEIEEIELERKVKAASARGRIDAFYRFVIFEVKTDLEAEREDALQELKKYFEAQQNPADFVAAVTDGLRFEIFDYIPKQRRPVPVRAFTLEPALPVAAYQELDELLAAGRKIPPVSGEVVIRFGPNSVVFSRSRHALRDAFEAVKRLPSVRTKFREWNSLLAKVYGSSPDDEDLFIKHTYLTMLSRAIVTMALFRDAPKKASLYRGLVTGDFFRARNIQNLAEPDFFSWALGNEAEQPLFEFFAHLFRRLGEFEWSKIDEDLLKVLYQELVDPDDRQLLGEFYTPDWLAELTLERIGYRGGTLLDPACGSGTFLFCAVRRLRKAGMEGNSLVEHALDSITGIDVHPVAVLMAKANILLALAGELAGFSGDVYLRVYLADTLMTGEDAKKKALPITVSDKEHFHIPLASLEHGPDLDALVDKMSQFAQAARSEKALEKAEHGFQKLLTGYSQDEAFLWRENFRLMSRLIPDRDTVWAFILKNAYRPAYLRQRKVNAIVGNPPWLSLRDIKDTAYKSKIKELAFRYKLLGKSERKLFTQLDTSTIFFAHCEGEFLQEGGTIAFVMPRSAILPAKQHLAFQKRGFTTILDFGDVKRLFKVPSCVLIRDQKASEDDIPTISWAGEFNRETRNLPWNRASRILTSTQSKYSFISVETAESPYFAQMFQGASLVPRCLWFVEIPPGFAANADTPYLRTAKSARALAKKPWVLEMEGVVESDFLYGTALAEDLLPFAVRKLRLVVLPVLRKEDRFVMLSHLDILSEGAPNTAKWVEKAEKIWNKLRKDKKQTIAERLNYDGLLTGQDPRAGFVVLYNKSGTNLAAAYLTPNEYRSIGGLPVRGFVADHVSYRYYADSEDHALYLVGVLNSGVVNQAIKPYQSRGLKGERDIHRRPFEVCPIPVFEPDRQLHQQIVAATRQAREIMLKWKNKIGGNAAQAREAARHVVRPDLQRLDRLAMKLLDGGRLVSPPRKRLEETHSLF